jgi:hypothetical protein
LLSWHGCHSQPRAHSTAVTGAPTPHGKYHETRTAHNATRQHAAAADKQNTNESIENRKQKQKAKKKARNTRATRAGAGGTRTHAHTWGRMKRQGGGGGGKQHTVSTAPPGNLLVNGQPRCGTHSDTPLTAGAHTTSTHNIQTTHVSNTQAKWSSDSLQTHRRANTRRCLRLFTNKNRAGSSLGVGTASRCHCKGNHTTDTDLGRHDGVDVVEDEGCHVRSLEREDTEATAQRQRSAGGGRGGWVARGMERAGKRPDKPPTKATAMAARGTYAAPL